MMKSSFFYVILFCLVLCSCGYRASDFNYGSTGSLQTENIETIEYTTSSIQAYAEATTFPATTSNTESCTPARSTSGRFVAKNQADYLEYWINIPKNAGIGMPLIVFLHGSHEIGRMDVLENYGIVTVVKDLYGEEFPFLLLMPCTHEYGWTKGSVSSTLKELIDSICEEYGADSSKIIITGHSLGSIGTWKMISTYGDFFSAAVPISCGIDEPMNFETCAEVPVKAFCGTVGDYEMNYNYAMHALVSKINDAGGNATMYTAEGASHDDTVTIFYTKELFAWMISQ